jgi:GNAT superfamily N-acetyltransferase
MGRERMVLIRQASETSALDDVRSLMRALFEEYRERHIDDMALINRYFDPVIHERELAALPGEYAPPAGALLIAYAAGKPAGCVMLHNLGRGACELRRMFVPAGFRGIGVGRALVDRVTANAKAANYSLMRLYTTNRQHEAIRLYERVGFVRTAPYYAIEDRILKDWLIFFELEL